MDEFNIAIKKYKRKKVSLEDSFVLYALYKQVTVGPCLQERPLPVYRPTNFWLMICKIPTRFDFTRVHRWEAWKKLENMSQDQACRRYVEIFNRSVS